MIPSYHRSPRFAARRRAAIGAPRAWRAALASGSLAVALVVTPADAQPAAPNDKAADAAFQEGRTLMGQGKLAEACAKLAESDRLAASGRAVLNLADCFERRAMVASAYAKFLEAAVRAVEAGRADAEHHARERAARLEPRLPRLTLAVPKETDSADLDVRLDGRSLPRSAWGSAEAVDPGAHTLEATAAGGRTWSSTFTAQEGKAQRIELRWPEAAKSDAPPAAPPAPTLAVSTPRPTGSDASSVKPLAITALGLGAIGVVVGSYAGLQVLNAKSVVNDHCTNHQCDQEGYDAASRGSTFQYVAPIAFAVGLGGIAAGSYLLLRPSPKTASVAVTPTTNGRSAGVFARGSF